MSLAQIKTNIVLLRSERSSIHPVTPFTRNAAVVPVGQDSALSCESKRAGVRYLSVESTAYTIMVLDAMILTCCCVLFSCLDKHSVFSRSGTKISRS